MKAIAILLAEISIAIVNCVPMRSSMPLDDKIPEYSTEKDQLNAGEFGDVRSSDRFDLSVINFPPYSNDEISFPIFDPILNDEDYDEIARTCGLPLWKDFDEMVDQPSLLEDQASKDLIIDQPADGKAFNIDDFILNDAGECQPQLMIHIESRESSNKLSLMGGGNEVDDRLLGKRNERKRNEANRSLSKRNKHKRNQANRPLGKRNEARVDQTAIMKKQREANSEAYDKVASVVGLKNANRKEILDVLINEVSAYLKVEPPLFEDISMKISRSMSKSDLSSVYRKKRQQLSDRLAALTDLLEQAGINVQDKFGTRKSTGRIAVRPVLQAFLEFYNK